ncbi:hypothetical protein CWE09_03770 [Aliidiomarina minuta]|uniref:Uncharacterized protein n=1 Tax=Aliidiomarina minuta TaxID=880057 RepID=A0A432W713_9GAMM|nr:hypothetical protein CWE09_03770 [Aliidiomarina minuta]
MFAMVIFLIVVPFFSACILQLFNKRIAVIVGVILPIVFITSIPLLYPESAGTLFEVLYFIYVPIFAAMNYIFWLIIRYLWSTWKK